MKYAFETLTERDFKVQELREKGVNVYGIGYYPFNTTPFKYVLFSDEEGQGGL